MLYCHSNNISCLECNFNFWPNGNINLPFFLQLKKFYLSNTSDILSYCLPVSCQFYVVSLSMTNFCLLAIVQPAARTLKLMERFPTHPILSIAWRVYWGWSPGVENSRSTHKALGEEADCALPKELVTCFPGSFFAFVLRDSSIGRYPRPLGVFPTAVASFYANLHSLRLLCPTQPFTFHLLLPSMTSFETSHNGKLL